MGKEEARNIKAYLRQEQKQMESFLKELVAMETPSGDQTSLSELLEFLRVSLEELGFRAERIPGRQSGGFLFAVPCNRKKIMTRLTIARMIEYQLKLKEGKVGSQ